jgi:hypothetical protein
MSYDQAHPEHGAGFLPLGLFITSCSAIFAQQLRVKSKSRLGAERRKSL